MEIYHFKNVKEKEKKGIVLGIGKFDGVHLGHQKLIKRILTNSKKSGEIPSVFTFRNFPVEFYITPWEEKLSLLEKSGIEICIWCDFEEVVNWYPDEFIDFLTTLNLKEVVVGFNFKFGKNREGNIDTLKEFSKRSNFSVSVIDPFKINGEIVNASKIRDFLKEGEIEKANTFLGRHFYFKGKVTAGSGRGRKIGFPTANIFSENRIEIGQGVYAGYVSFKGKFYKAAVNVGMPLTFGEKEKRIEVHIIDFDGEIYGQYLTVFLTRKIRDVQYFSSPEELKKRIKKDIDHIKNTLPEKNL